MSFWRKGVVAVIFIYMLIFAALVLAACVVVVARRDRRTELPDDPSNPSRPTGAEHERRLPTAPELEARARVEMDRRFMP
jgi:hypothetical protein